MREIKARTEKGVDRNNNSFAPYSSSYKKSDNFKLGGKSPSHVNLRLLGEMMGNLKVLHVTESAVVVGFTNDTERAKAHGHITGHNGEVSKKGKHYPVRDFLGLPPEIIQNIYAKYKDTGRITDAANLVRRVTGETQIKRPQPKTDRGYQGTPVNNQKQDRGYNAEEIIKKRQDAALAKIRDRGQSMADRILERMGLITLGESK